jgi:hypothetical protein
LYSRYIKKLSFLKTNMYIIAGITALDLILSGFYGDLNEEKLLNTSISLAGTIGFALLTQIAVNSSLMGIAYTFGTTSTGIAISSLSGAAATNASLAWLGGGALSAGGGGMAAGAALISGVTLGILFVVPLAYTGYNYFNNKEADELIRKDKIQYLYQKYNYID